MHGIIKFYNKRKGYGYIIEESGKNEYFYHITDIVGEREPNYNDYVSFDPTIEEKGYRAKNIVLKKQL